MAERQFSKLDCTRSYASRAIRTNLHRHSSLRELIMVSNAAQSKSRKTPIYGGEFTGVLNEKMWRKIMAKHFNHEAFTRKSRREFLKSVGER